MNDPKATAAFLAPKLGLSLAVMERNEGRKQRYGGEPLSGQAVADQQAVADNFFKLGLLSRSKTWCTTRPNSSPFTVIAHP